MKSMQPGSVQLGLVILGLVTMAYGGGPPVADKPNFSGEWRMNAAKSRFGGYPGPASYLRTITHVGESITIVSEQSGGAGDGRNTVSVTTDGKPISVDVNGTTTIATAGWEDSALITTTTIESYAVEFKDRMSLSGDGKELISVVEVTSTLGKSELTIVFDRQ